jgi:uncharacterized C2H2 Zn-finger protein
MKIYCWTCKEACLETSDGFQIGQKPHGGMFRKLDVGGNWIHFDFKEHIKDGDLHCPRCMASFVGPKNELLTEHGIIYQGQESVDTRFSIIYTEGMLRGMLGRIEGSRPVARPMKQPNEITIEKDSETIDYPDVDTKLALKGPASAEEDAAWQGECALVCPSCGREYQNTEKGRPWYEKHIATCSKKSG